MEIAEWNTQNQASSADTRSFSLRLALVEREYRILEIGGQRTCSGKGQRISILGFAGRPVSVPTVTGAAANPGAATDNAGPKRTARCQHTPSISGHCNLNFM